MKRLFLMAAMGALFAANGAMAQTSLDVIIQDLNDAQQQHDSAASQAMSAFLGALATASQSGPQALELYKNAGGNLPDLTPVRKHYDYETPSERQARELVDAQNYAQAAIVIQVHCGLMRYAALLGMKPPPPDTQEQWLTWLKTIADVYPQLAGDRALKSVAMRDSVITNFLKYHAWDDTPQGQWTVRDLPRLYHDLILEPMRHPPGPGTLDAWDTYIAMRQADQPDHDRWTSEEPPLDFDRAADDFAIEPTLEKLSTLDGIIKANTTDDHIGEWIKRLRAMVTTYRQGGSRHSSLPAPTPGTPAAGTTAPAPAATPGTPSAGTAVPTPAATPGTPASGTTAPTP